MIGSMPLRLRQRHRRSVIERLESRHLLAVSVANLPATDLTPTSATVGFEVQEIGAFNPVVTLYWGKTNGGTVFNAWENKILVDGAELGAHTFPLTGLEIDTQYFYSSYAFSFDGFAWAPEVASFSTLPPGIPSIRAETAWFVGVTNAGVRGQVLDVSGQIPSVTLYYGDNDGGDDPQQWDVALELGEQTGSFQATLQQLKKETEYFFRFAATNMGGTGWTETQRFQTPGARPLLISEISAGGVSEGNDEFVFGTRVRSSVEKAFEGDLLEYDWIEIQNTTDLAADLGGFALTDDADDLAKWVFPEGTAVPANDEIIVFASDLNITDFNRDELGAMHTNFRLAGSGEYLALVHPDGTVVDQFAPIFPAQTLDVSYGVFAGALQYMPEPTPNEANRPGLSGLASRPSISAPSGSFTTNLSVEMTAAAANAEIRYTVDGSVPDETSLLYEGPIEVTQTTEFRARTFVPGHVPSEITGESYVKIADDLMDFSSDLPIVMLENFDRRRATSARHSAFFLSIFDVNAETGRSSLFSDPHIATRIGIKVRGQSSSGDPKTPYRVEFRNQHDEDLPLAPLGLPSDSDWVLHGPWSDRTLVHNSIAYELGADLGINTPRTRYVELFRNQNGGSLERGDYLGLYLLVESVKRSEDRVNVPDLDPGQVLPDEITGGYILRFEQEVVEAADRLDGWRFLELFDGQKYSPEQKEWITNYVNQAHEAIGQAGTDTGYHDFIDVDSFINGLVIHELGRDQDAYVRSWYLYKDRGGKLVAGPLWDFNLIWNRGCCFDNRNPRGWQFDQEWNKGEHNWYGKLMDSWEFSQQFIDRWTHLRQDGNDLSLENLFARIDRHVAEIAEATERNYERWPQQLNAGTGFGGPRFPTHQEHIDDMKDWITRRVEWIDDQFRAPPALSRQALSFELSTTAGEVYYTLDGSDPIDLATGQPSATAMLYAGQPVTVADGTTVIARVFDASVNPRRTELTKTQWSAPVSLLVTEAAPAESGNLAITEFSYNPYPALTQFGEIDANNDEFEFIELQNISDRTIDLTGVRFVSLGQGNDSQGIQFAFAPQLLLAGERIVVAKNVQAFQSRYGGGFNLAKGEGNADSGFAGQLSNGGETLRILAKDRSVITQMTYDDRDAWSRRADGRGSSLVNVNPGADPNDPANWRASQTFGGSPGMVAAPATRDVVINEILSNSDQPLVDQIELLNTSDSAVDVSGWYVSDSGRQLLKFKIDSPEAVLPPGGFFVLDQTQLGFGFSGQDDDDAWLVQPDANGKPFRFADQIEFGPTATDVSLGRWPDGTGPLVPMSTRTFGAANSGPAEQQGDLNGDGLVDEADIQHVCAAIAANDPPRQTDLNADGRVDHQDLRMLVVDLMGSTIGDANLDGIFNSSDLVSVFQAAEYEDGIPQNSSWSRGDWNCDGEFTSSDLVTAFREGAYVAARPVPAHALPSLIASAVLRSTADQVPARDSFSVTREANPSQVVATRSQDRKLSAQDVDSIFERELFSGTQPAIFDDLARISHSGRRFSRSVVGGGY